MGIYLPSFTELKCPAGSSPKSQAIKQKDALSASVYNLRHAHPTPACHAHTAHWVQGWVVVVQKVQINIRALDIISDHTYANILAVGTSNT